MTNWLVDFNSSKVRLKAETVLEPEVGNYNFNSSKVRLKAGKQEPMPCMN